jgi:hypothetical protein
LAQAKRQEDQLIDTMRGKTNLDAGLMRNTARSPSVTSHLKCRIEALEFEPGGVGGEVPIDFGFELIAMSLPGGYFAAHGVDGRCCMDAAEAG